MVPRSDDGRVFVASNPNRKLMSIKKLCRNFRDSIERHPFIESKDQARVNQLITDIEGVLSMNLIEIPATQKVRIEPEILLSPEEQERQTELNKRGMATIRLFQEQLRRVKAEVASREREDGGGDDPVPGSSTDEEGPSIL